MSFTIYNATIPVFKQGLKTLNHLLNKMEAHAKAKNIPAENFLNAKLAIDMFDLKRQVQLSCDFAKGAAMRLSGQEIPAHPDTETTVEQLRARIVIVQTLLDGVMPEQFKGAETRDIKIVTPNNMTFEFKGDGFVTGWALPHFYFHVTTAYNILRQNGVEIGKADFLRGE